MATINQDSVRKYQLQRKKILTAGEYLEGILARDRNILAQAITLIESNLPEHQPLARELLVSCLPHSGSSLRLGITGVPGVGKSTFIEAFGSYITSQDHQLAVLAIDPSSDRSKGSILGDKTRMEALSANPSAFIRPSPSGGSLGGVARKSRETIILCEAAGYDIIIIETVGVGQSETSVHSMVDFFLLLMLAGAGDELQGIKRGIMEMADGIAITKADGENVNKAELAKTEFENALHLYPPSESGWIPEVLLCSALENQGISDTWELINRYHDHSLETGYFRKRRQEQARYWMHEFITESLKSHFYNSPGTRERIEEMEEKLREAKTSSFYAAEELLGEYFKLLNP
jgi:LAO/AO transport system kinase